MKKSIVIVESPSKAKTIMSYLGDQYFVLASYGHIRDLPSKSGSVDPDKDFSMIWTLGDRGAKHLGAIISAVKSAENLFLATDPDREGEAISWHVLQALKEKNALSDKINVKRVVFHEITKQAVQSAIKNPRDLDHNLVEAYLARRALDYLVGFTLSPLLWRRLPGARSAGRVQSVALRLIVQRETEIESFKTQEYWDITGIFDKKTPFQAKLAKLKNKKLDKFSLSNEQEAQDAAQISMSSKPYHVKNVQKKKTKRNPTAPFMTSTLQQEASRKLGFSASKTMTLAQKLYEGVSIKGETTGLITYMRTDSTNLSKDAIKDIRDFLQKDFGEDYLPKTPREYKKKVKNAQEAHEAIRPTNIFWKSKDLETHLDKDQLRLYELIWKRTLASQMESALFDQLSFDLEGEHALFHATGKTLVFDGFLALYQEGKDDTQEEDEEKLPHLSENQEISLESVEPKQHFTQPPPRYTEASLVKTLEELGIGRPSTYATLLQILQDRNYVRLDQKRFTPENSGRLVTAYLQRFCHKYVEYDFTAQMEEFLDLISSGEKLWKDVLQNFWIDFKQTIKDASAFRIAEVIDQLEIDLASFLFASNIDRKCPNCSNGKIGLRLGKFGSFLGCSNYPECNYTSPLSGDPLDVVPRQEVIDIGIDPEENVLITLRYGPYGRYFQWDNEKKKRISVSPTLTDDDLTLDYAMTLKSFPKKIGIHPETKADIFVSTGRFGPYIVHEKTNASIPKSVEKYWEISPEYAIQLLNNKEERKRKKEEKMQQPPQDLIQ
jgi:DNA topoisomerase-1